MSFRTAEVTADGLVQLLTDMGSNNDLRLCGHGIPKGTGIAGVSLDEETRTFQVKLVHHNWPDEFPPDRPIHLQYAVRHGHAGHEGDWGAPQPIGPADA